VQVLLPSLEEEVAQVIARLTSILTSPLVNAEVGKQVAHPRRGVGTVAELMKDGRIRVTFDSGEEHRYNASSFHKFSEVAANQHLQHQATVWSQFTARRRGKRRPSWLGPEGESVLDVSPRSTPRSTPNSSPTFPRQRTGTMPSSPSDSPHTPRQKWQLHNDTEQAISMETVGKCHDTPEDGVKIDAIRDCEDIEAKKRHRPQPVDTNLSSNATRRQNACTVESGDNAVEQDNPEAIATDGYEMAEGVRINVGSQAEAD